jgi:hypothetical protein
MNAPITDAAIDDKTRSEIEAFESRIDNLHSDLALLRYPKNLALWAFVTNGLERLYQDQQQQPEHDRTIQTVVSRRFGVFLRKIQNYPFTGHAPIKTLRLTPDIRQAALQANSYAQFWFAATGYFPEWHRQECGASLLDANSLRFNLTGTARERRLSGYQKGFRCAVMRIPSQSVYAPVPEWIQAHYSRALNPGTTRDERLVYRIPQDVYEYYRDWYGMKMREAVEHPIDTDLGAYDMGDAINFWSALASFSAVHDFLCYVAGRRARLPVNSILAIRKREVWLEELARLSGLGVEKCGAILQQIVCQPRSVIDLHVTPFLALDEKGVWLALAAPLAISGRFDQNLLRICSAENPTQFNRVTPRKEQRLRDELSLETAPLNIHTLGPFSLPSPLPDVDLVLEDRVDDSLVIAELKWIRPPIGWKSRDRANEELRKGLEQLSQIREFLTVNPSYLVKGRRGIDKPISQFKNVYYAVIARGHIIDVNPQILRSVVPFDAMKFALKSERRLTAAMRWSLADSWLPEEGVDFKIQNARYAYKSSAIEAPVFTPI